MIRYRLDDLGWFQFEWLCQSLLKATLGLSVEAWGGHSDLGRDAYCPTALNLQKNGPPTRGPFVFQAKFVEEANSAGANPREKLREAVMREVGRIRERLKTLRIQHPTTYILITNVPVGALSREKIKALISRELTSATILVWGASDVCAMLDTTPQIRLAFPQLLGLRDLQELLTSAVDAEILQRSTLSLSRAAELAPVFVPTRAYNRALEILTRYNFTVLTGPPEVGKTTIARLIGLAKLGEGWDCYECNSPSDVLRLRRGENAKVFVADDAFGTTEYRPEIAHAWAKDLDSVLRALDERHWLIWTSRPAPLRLALQRMHLQGKAERFPQPAEVLVDAAELSPQERALILYRHAKHAGLDKAAKELVKAHASLIISNMHFTPERAKRFIQQTLPQLVAASADVDAIRAAVMREIEEPTVSMTKSFNSLDREHQQVLISMLDAGSGAVTSDALTEAVRRQTGSESNVAQLTDDLSAHFLRCTEEDSN